jgi:hypothetical protein
MKLFKQFSVSLLAFAAASAFATSQPFNAINASITVDAAAVNANLAGFAIGTVGGATYTNGTLTAPVASVSTSADPGPITVGLSSGAGLKFTKLLTPSITLSNFSFNTATNELTASLLVGTTAAPLLNIQNQSVLVASDVTSSFGGVAGTSVASSSVSRDLGLDAKNFALSQSFKDFMWNTYELDASQFGYLASIVKEVKVGTVSIAPVGNVPEPTTYALMGVGLACMGMVMRRRQQG